MVKRKGAALVTVILIAVILLILVISILVNSVMSTRSSNYISGLYIAEAGVEFARGGYQHYISSGGTSFPEAWFDSSAFPGGAGGAGAAETLRFTDGSIVTYPNVGNPLIDGQPASGIPLDMPQYDESGAFLGNKRIGYFAYRIINTEPIEIYSIGAIGSTATSIRMIKGIHARIKPVAYTDFSKFIASPFHTGNDAIFVTNSSRDPIDNSLLFTGTSGTNRTVAPGDSISGGSSLLSFNKSFLAGQLSLYTSSASNKQFVGFEKGSYYFTKADAAPAVNVAVGSQSVDLHTSGGNSGLFTNQSNIGLPNNNNLYGTDGYADGDSTDGGLDGQLANLAKGSGLYIEGNGFWPNSNSDRGSIDSTHVDSSDNKPYKVTLSLTPDESATEVTIKNIRFGTQKVWNSVSNALVSTSVTSQTLNFNGSQYTLNSTGTTSPPLPSGVNYSVSGGVGTLNFNINSLSQHIIYTRANMEVSGDASDNYKFTGKMSLYSPGKLDVTGNLIYKSYNKTGSSGSYSFSSSPNDMLGLMSPNKINLNPVSGQKEGFTLTAALMQLGTTDSANRNKFTISTQNYAPTDSYNEIFLYGSQVNFTRSGNWYSNYTNVYQPFDTNLLQFQPPLSPVLSAGHNIVYWREINMNTGQDIEYQ